MPILHLLCICVNDYTRCKAVKNQILNLKGLILKGPNAISMREDIVCVSSKIYSRSAENKMSAELCTQGEFLEI